MQEEVKDFIKLSKKIKKCLDFYDDKTSLSETEQRFIKSIHYTSIKNSWFTTSNIKLALEGIVSMLNEDDYQNWLNHYDLKNNQPKKVGLIMAGNLPAVGFNDLLCVLVSGNIAKIKCSSDDNVLIPALIELLVDINTFWEARIELVEGRLTDFEAVIATGSNNSARYFEYYFGKYPNIIRKSRTSLAVISGSETKEDYKNLHQDIFAYFGLGCRNVNFLLVHESVEITSLIENLIPNDDSIMKNNKYLNNLDYNKSVYLINKEKFYDGGGFFLLEKDTLFSPIGVLNFKRYSSNHEVKTFINSHENQLQCVVDGSGVFNKLSPGKTQTPTLFDYADGIDTMKFLTNL